MVNEGVNRMNFGIRFSLYQVPMAFSEGGWAGRVRDSFFSLDGKLSLKVDETQIGQRHEEVERKREYYHIIIFPERTWKFIKGEEDKWKP